MLSRNVGTIRLVAGACLAVCVALFVFWSWHWPLVGDAALIHYIAFLTEHGMAPYRDLGDMNMPGSFLIELAAMHVFGYGDLAWRLFDFTLLLVAGLSFLEVTGRAGRFPGMFAGCLFALIHGRDGLAEGGQRDLTMAVCLIASTALLSLAMRKRSGWGAAGFGLLAGVALTIKPTALPLSVVQLALGVWVMKRWGSSKWRVPIVPGLAGMLSGPLVAVGFLLREHAVGAFWAGLHGIVPYYASLGHRPFGFLLLHSISPLLPLVIVWVVVMAVTRPKISWDRVLLGCGVVFGLISYLVQARGLPYYRYPLLVFLLPLMALDLTQAIGTTAWATAKGKAAGGLALAGICFGGLFLGPQSAILIHRYRWWETDFITSLEGDLDRLGGYRLWGQVQCVDSISGCGTTLYRMRLKPATGVLSDFLLFGPADVPVVQQTRAGFLRAIEADPPRVIVVSSWLHMDGPGGYQKLDRWPAFEGLLANQYRLDTDWAPSRNTRWWSREETPAGYRIYVLNATPGKQ